MKISKTVHPEKLKGTKLEEIASQSKIAQETARGLAKAEGKKKAKCWVCGSSKSKDAVSVYGIEFVQCANCSHAYQKYIIPETEVIKFFTTDEDINCHLPQEQFNYRAKYVSKPQVEEVMRLRKERKKEVKKGSWLDLGCGAGNLLYQVKKMHNWDAVGIDINKQGVDMAKKHGVRAYQTDTFGYYNDISNGKEKFDVISAVGYFDLITHPLKHLEVVKKLLKHKGMFMIAQPRFNSLTVDSIKTFPECAIRYCNAVQRSIFTDKSMKMFLEKNGFKIIFDWTYGMDFYTYMAMVTMKIPRLADSNMHKFFVEHYNEFQTIIDKHKHNDNLFYIAELK